jgi:uncharacterized protein YjbI with pentapeptide repeats
VQFVDATFEGCSFKDADFSGADLRGADSHSWGSLEGARYNDETELGDVEPDEAGMRKK